MAKKEPPAYILDSSVIIRYLYPTKSEEAYLDKLQHLFEEYDNGNLGLYIPVCVQAEISSFKLFTPQKQNEKSHPLDSEEAKRKLNDFLANSELDIIDEDAYMGLLANQFSQHLNLTGIDALILAVANKAKDDGLNIKALYTYDKPILKAVKYEMYEALGGTVPATEVPEPLVPRLPISMQDQSNNTP